MKVGSEPAQDAERVAAVRKAIGSAGLFVDANGAYSRKQALCFVDRFADCGVTWFEEPYPALTVKEAWAKAREYWENPQKFESQAQTGSFKEIAEKWVKRHVQANKLISQGDIERLLKKYVYPRWGERPFLEIRRREVNDLLDDIVDNHGPAQADAVLAIIRGIMNWHRSRDEDYTSPIVRGMRRNKNKARKRILDDVEIRALWETADGPFGAILKLCLLTAQRRTKVASMRLDDLKDGVWTIAATDREKGTGGELTLPKAALDLIAAQPRIAGNPYIFAGRGRSAFNAWAQRKDELDEELKFERAWVVHDLRRTARSLMSRAGVLSEHAERVLGHAIAGVEGVYDRHRYFKEKGDALGKLAALIETIVNPPKGNVIALVR
jgi:integrase